MDCILCSHCCSVPVTAAPRPPVVSLQRSVGQQQSEGALGAAVCVMERGLGEQHCQKEPQGTAVAAIAVAPCCRRGQSGQQGNCEQVSCMGTAESRPEPLIDHLRRVLSQLQGHR